MFGSSDPGSSTSAVDRIGLEREAHLVGPPQLNQHFAFLRQEPVTRGVHAVGSRTPDDDLPIGILDRQHRIVRLPRLAQAQLRSAREPLRGVDRQHQPGTRRPIQADRIRVRPAQPAQRSRAEHLRLVVGHPNTPRPEPCESPGARILQPKPWTPSSDRTSPVFLSEENLALDHFGLHPGPHAVLLQAVPARWVDDLERDLGSGRDGKREVLTRLPFAAQARFRAAQVEPPTLEVLGRMESPLGVRVDRVPTGQSAEPVVGVCATSAALLDGNTHVRQRQPGVRVEDGPLHLSKGDAIGLEAHRLFTDGLEVQARRFGAPPRGPVNDELCATTLGRFDLESAVGRRIYARELVAEQAPGELPIRARRACVARDHTAANDFGIRARRRCSSRRRRAPRVEP